MCWYDTAEEKTQGKYVNATTVHLTLCASGRADFIGSVETYLKGTGAVIAVQDTDCGYS